MCYSAQAARQAAGRRVAQQQVPMAAQEVVQDRGGGVQLLVILRRCVSGPRPSRYHVTNQKKGWW